MFVNDLEVLWSILKANIPMTLIMGTMFSFMWRYMDKRFERIEQEIREESRERKEELRNFNQRMDVTNQRMDVTISSFNQRMDFLMMDNNRMWKILVEKKGAESTPQN